MAKEKDFLKLYKSIDSRAYRFFSNPSTYFTIMGIGGLTTCQTLIKEDWYPLFAFPILIGLSLKLYSKLLPINKEDYLLNKIKQTSEYQECQSLYDDYISKIAELFKSLHLHNIFDTCNLLDILLNAGLFSDDYKYEFHNYQKELISLDELTGARIITGRGVCRHEAAFATNVLNRIGYKTAVIVVKKEKELLENFDPEQTLWDHAVVGIQEKGQKILYDTTVGRFAGQDSTLNTSIDKCALLYPPVEDKYVFINPCQTFFSKIRNINIDEFMKLPLTELNPKKLEQSIYDTKTLFEENVLLFVEFQKENYEQVQRIAKLEKKIFPYSDNEITEWKLK